MSSPSLFSYFINPQREIKKWKEEKKLKRMRCKRCGRYGCLVLRHRQGLPSIFIVHSKKKKQVWHKGYFTQEDIRTIPQLKHLLER